MEHKDLLPFYTPGYGPGHIRDAEYYDSLFEREEDGSPIPLPHVDCTKSALCVLEDGHKGLCHYTVF